MRRTLILLALPALVAVGCGGSSNLSAKDLRSKANAICAKVNTETANLTTAPQLDKALVITKKAVGDLKKLKPPSSLKASYGAFIDRLDASLPVLTQAVAAVDAKNAAKAKALAAQGEALNTQVNAAATAAGLAQCAKNS
jgi:hypothetical protein